MKRYQTDQRKDQHMKLKRMRLILLVVTALAAAACGSTSEAAATPTNIEITASDFSFGGLPNRVAAGTTISLVNDSDVELHEFVAIPLPASETRSGEELMADPEGLVAYFPAVETVILAEPGQDGFAVEGTSTLNIPGRYLIICAIPTGADPAEYIQAAAETEGGPPQVDGGPPHFVHGMWQEITVDG